MLALDCLLLIMIAICTVYCWLLNRRIQDLQNSRIEFANMIKGLNAAISKANLSVTDLSNLSQITTSKLKACIEEAQATTGKLTIVNDIGTSLVTTLTTKITDIKHAQKNANLALTTKGLTSGDDFKDNSNYKFSDDDFTDNSNQQQVSHLSQNAGHKTSQRKNFITNITKTPAKSPSLDQMSYYNTLKRISIKK